ncbi:hypothetical protein [Deinococcus pimensis]|uniref:hypothetical protein n=1 Tax=Deinococcus pimensis TaxID=309888 RepID=UPI00048A20DE|nr:hypothetical protein [Deinococcus pimensis]
MDGDPLRTIAEVRALLTQPSLNQQEAATLRQGLRDLVVALTGREVRDEEVQVILHDPGVFDEHLRSWYREQLVTLELITKPRGTLDAQRHAEDASARTHSRDGRK